MIQRNVCCKSRQNGMHIKTCSLTRILSWEMTNESKYLSLKYLRIYYGDIQECFPLNCSHAMHKSYKSERRLDDWRINCHHSRRQLLRWPSSRIRYDACMERSMSSFLSTTLFCMLPKKITISVHYVHALFAFFPPS